jgi:RHS repeat-associated protein
VTLPGGGAAAETRTITYTYDSLYRLITAVYTLKGAGDTGEYFHYTYDDVGNRLTEEKKTSPSGLVESTSYTYDDANRMLTAGGVTYEWDNNGNLLNDGVNTYTYNHANRLTMVDGPSSMVSFTYNGLGDRLSETINGVTTIFTLDLNTGLTQVLSDGVHVYLYGLGRIAQIAGSDSVYFLGDALGSVRQLADGQGTVILARAYEPYGSVLSTAGEDATKYGFTGEWQENGLVFLRARYYNTDNGIMVKKDPWIGIEKLPITGNKWNYAYANPIKYFDKSGLSPTVDCSNWDWYFKDLCERSNGDDSNSDTLKARETLFYYIAYGGYGRYWILGGSGYAQAAAMLFHFLDGGGAPKFISLPSSSPFVNDPGIARATRTYVESSNIDEPEIIIPLLHDFLGNFVKPVAINNDGDFKVESPKIFGLDHYFPRPDKIFGREPRARNPGYWAAFGHVIIDGKFSAKGKKGCIYDGYLISYVADYQIDDRYEWFQGKMTPFPFGMNGELVWIPHEWEISLVAASIAHEYDFTIEWRESERLFVKNDFLSFTTASWWVW